MSKLSVDVVSWPQPWGL